MEMNTRYYQEIVARFTERCPDWARDAVRWTPKHTHAIRVTLGNGDSVDYNMRSDSYRYRYADQPIMTNPNDITDEDCREAFSINLAEMMQTKGFGQASLAECTGLSSAMISKYLNRKSTPTLTNLLKIARALDCHPDQLME